MPTECSSNSLHFGTSGGRRLVGAFDGGAITSNGGVLLFADAAGMLLRVFPHSVLGVILFLAGAELVLGSRDTGTEKVDRFVMLATAALAVWNVGIAVVFGILSYHLSKRGWLKL